MRKRCWQCWPMSWATGLSVIPSNCWPCHRYDCIYHIHLLYHLFLLWQANLLVSLAMFGFFMEQDDVYTSFGFLDARPTVIGVLLIFQLIFIPYNEVTPLIISSSARHIISLAHPHSWCKLCWYRWSASLSTKLTGMPDSWVEVLLWALLSLN